MAENKEDNLIDKADTAAKRLEDANKKFEELLKRQEELAASQRLGGKSEGGEAPSSEDIEKKKARAEALKLSAGLLNEEDLR